MTETDTLAYDFATARRVANLLRDEDIPAVAEEHEIGMAHIRLDPEDNEPTGYIAIAADIDDDETGEPSWVMVQTFFDKELHTYESPEDAPMESLGIPVDSAPEEVAEAILDFLA